MSKVIAVFGAGTGLGVSVARRFGREGFRVALVARRKERLDALVAQLADEGVEAAPFAADLSDPTGVPALVDAIRDRFGRIDVVEYGPIGGDVSFTPAVQLDAATVEGLSRLLLLTPVEVFRAVGLPALGRLAPGTPVAFEAVSIETAEAAYRQHAALLAALPLRLVAVLAAPTIDGAALLAANLVSGVVSANDPHWEQP